MMYVWLSELLHQIDIWWFKPGGLVNFLRKGKQKQRSQITLYYKISIFNESIKCDKTA